MSLHILAYCEMCEKNTPSRLLDSDYKMGKYFLQITKCLDCTHLNLLKIDLETNKKQKNDTNFSNN